MEVVHLDRFARVVERRFVSRPSESARHPAIAVNTRGDVLAAWETSQADIEVAVRRRGGRWRVKVINRGGIAQSPAVALTDSGAGLVAFRVGSRLRVAALSARRGWGRPTAVGPAGTSNYVPVRVAMAPTGAAAVTWEEGINAGESGESGPVTVLVARRGPHQSFSSRRTTVLHRQPSPLLNFGNSDVAVAGDGATLVGWIDESGARLAYAPAAGGFQSPVALAADDSLYRIVVALGGGRAYAAWTGAQTTGATDGPAGGDVAAPQTLLGGSSCRLQLALAADERQAVLAVPAGGNGPCQVFASRDG
jgi:hypothetical protein